MKILVTGATGFVGRALCERILSDTTPGYSAVVATGRNAEVGTQLALLGASFVVGDICNHKFVQNLITDDIDAVVHCAGVTGLGGPPSMYSANLMGTRTVADRAFAVGVRRVVNIGTPTIYFDYSNDLNRDEDHIPARFPNAYASSKAFAEHELLSRPGDVTSAISLRPRFVTGAQDTNVLGRFVRMHVAGELAQIGNGNNLVDFTAVENVVDAILLALAAPPELHGNAYNITNGDSVRFTPFLNSVFSELGLPQISKKVPYSVAFIGAWFVAALARLKGIDPKLSPLGVAMASKSMTMDIDRARNDLGYVPRVSNSQMRTNFCQWWSTQQH